jgi:hypothetical protein
MSMNPTEVYHRFRALYALASAPGRTPEIVSEYFSAALLWTRLRRTLPASTLANIMR